MKFLVIFSLIAAVASANLLRPALVSDEMSEIQEIIAAINSPSTDPATAAALEQMLFETLGVSATYEPSPVSIVDVPVEPIAVAPVVAPTPVVDVSAVDSTPLVQIILNINQASSAAPAASVSPVSVEGPLEATQTVQFVDQAQNLEVDMPMPISIGG